MARKTAQTSPGRVAVAAASLVVAVLAVACGGAHHRSASSATRTTVAAPSTTAAIPSPTSGGNGVSIAPAGPTTSLGATSPTTANGVVDTKQSSSTPPVSTTGTAPTVPAPPATTRPAVPISVALIGFPATIVAGGPPVTFSARLTNNSQLVANAVAPVFQIVGGPCNCMKGALQIEGADGQWHSVVMPEGDGQNPLLYTSGSMQLIPGQTATASYRLTLSAANRPGPALALLYAVDTTGHGQAGEASVPTTVTLT